MCGNSKPAQTNARNTAKEVLRASNVTLVEIEQEVIKTRLAEVYRRSGLKIDEIVGQAIDAGKADSLVADLNIIKDLEGKLASLDAVPPSLRN